MKVFISWSGEPSKQVAELVSTWIEDVLQGVKSWISTEDIEKGSIWFNEISDQFKDTGVGILCLTKENVSAPWILFEAGALSKGLTKSRVCPLLVNIEPTDLLPPLSQFNATQPNKVDMVKLLKMINKQSGEKALADDRVEKAVEMWWPQFELKFANILKGFKPTTVSPKRPAEDMIGEVLELTRSIHKRVQASHVEPSLVLVDDIEAELKKRVNRPIPPFAADITEHLAKIGLNTVAGITGLSVPSENVEFKVPPLNNSSIKKFMEGGIPSIDDTGNGPA